MESRPDFALLMLLFIPVVATIGLFTWLAVLGWSRERRREREAFYRHETARKMIEAGRLDHAQFEAFLAEEAARPAAARRTSLAIAGVVLFLAGVGLRLFLEELSNGAEAAPGPPPSLAWIPLFIGAALLVCAAFEALLARRSRRKSG